MRWPSKDPADYAAPVRSPRVGTWWNGGAPLRVAVAAWAVIGLVAGLVALAVSEDENLALWVAFVVGGLGTVGADAAWFLSGRDPVARAPWGRRSSS